MRTKKIHFNGKSKELVDFLTQQFPEKYLAAFKILLDLQYPITDSQVFYGQIEKIKEDDVVKELLLSNFTPGDFGLESAFNALEKFQFNVRLNHIPKAEYGRYNYPYESNYGRMPASGYSMYNPYREYPTGIPFERNVFPMEQFNTLKSPTYFWPEWKMQKDFTRTYMNREWEFGKDIFGYVATSLFSELVGRGMREDYAYNFAREKEIACRSFIPTFDVEFNERALFVFASHFILLGKDVKESYWAAKLFLTKPYTGYTKSDPITPYFDKFSPKMKKEFVEPVM
jgi:hypothetical protein